MSYQSPACEGQSELFFPEAGERWDGPEARALCAECPLLAACTKYAEEHYVIERPGRGFQRQVIAGAVRYDTRKFAYDEYMKPVRAERRERERRDARMVSEIYAAFEDVPYYTYADDFEEAA